LETQEQSNPIIFGQDREKLRMALPQLARQRKKPFGGHGEKLGGIGRGVTAQKSFASRLQIPPQPLKVPVHHPLPTLCLIAAPQGRSAIGIAVEEIELVSELVNDKIMTCGGIACFA